MTAKPRGDHVQCPDCLERFVSTKLYDRHRAVIPRTGREWRCMSAQELAARDFIRTDRGVWIESKRPGTAAQTDLAAERAPPSG